MIWVKIGIKENGSLGTDAEENCRPRVNGETADRDGA
jgi:hypothetical protein